MNKYQKFIIENLIKFLLWDGVKPNMNRCEAVEDSIELKQNDDISITNYMLVIDTNGIYSASANKIKIEYYKNGKWIIPNGNYEGEPAINFNFDNPIEKIRIFSANGLFDPFEMKIDCVYADKEVYYAKKKVEEEAKRMEEQKALDALIKPEHKTGADLVNIYWNKINDDVAYARISVYMISNNESRLIGDYKETNTMFKSITGLAYGTYSYQIIEYDSSNNEVAKTENIKFEISEPNTGFIRPWVV